MSEIWKPVVGFEGAYEVSDLGRVRSLARYFIDAIGRRQFRKGQVLVGSTGAGVYPLFILYRESVGVPRYLHDLVAEVFIGPKPVGAVLRHRDDNPLNNVPANLQYGSQRDNMQDAITNNCMLYAEDHPQTVYSRGLIAELMLFKGQATSATASAIFGISARYIREIWAGEARTRG